MTPLSVFWFRRDLRLEDNAGLFQALVCGRPVLPIFIFDLFILDSLPHDDARVTFTYDILRIIRTRLQAQISSSLALYHGMSLDVFDRILRSCPVAAMYTNHDYEPYAQARDDAVRKWLQSKLVDFHSYKDHVLFEKNEITKDEGSPYVIYTPYMHKWKVIQHHTALINYPSETKLMNMIRQSHLPDLSLADIGFKRSTIAILPYRLDDELLQHYERDRNFPAIAGTSRLDPHLRFGTVSIRKIFQVAQPISEALCNELIWREFFSQILWHFPHTWNKSFKSTHASTQCKRFMHNRMRMITASFLCKHLLIDWRWGEA